MGAYRMATITLWQTEDPMSVRGTWSVFLRFGARDSVTLLRGEITSQAPVGVSPEEWLLEALEGWLSRPA